MMWVPRTLDLLVVSFSSEDLDLDLALFRRGRPPPPFWRGGETG